MPVVLIVEPQLCDTRNMLGFAEPGWLSVHASNPLRGTYALHALQFDVVVVPLDKVEAPEYASLFATMRLMAPASILVCALPVPAEEDRECSSSSDDARTGRMFEEAAGAPVC